MEALLQAIPEKHRRACAYCKDDPVKNRDLRERGMLTCLKCCAVFYCSHEHRNLDVTQHVCVQCDAGLLDTLENPPRQMLAKRARRWGAERSARVLAAFDHLSIAQDAFASASVYVNHHGDAAALMSEEEQAYYMLAVDERSSALALLVVAQEAFSVSMGQKLLFDPEQPWAGTDEQLHQIIRGVFMPRLAVDLEMKRDELYKEAGPASKKKRRVDETLAAIPLPSYDAIPYPPEPKVEHIEAARAHYAALAPLAMPAAAVGSDVLLTEALLDHLPMGPDVDHGRVLLRYGSAADVAHATHVILTLAAPHKTVIKSTTRGDTTTTTITTTTDGQPQRRRKNIALPTLPKKKQPTKKKKPPVKRVPVPAPQKHRTLHEEDIPVPEVPILPTPRPDDDGDDDDTVDPATLNPVSRMLRSWADYFTDSAKSINAFMDNNRYTAAAIAALVLGTGAWYIGRGDQNIVDTITALVEHSRDAFNLTEGRRQNITNAKDAIAGIHSKVKLSFFAFNEELARNRTVLRAGDSIAIMPTVKINNGIGTVDALIQLCSIGPSLGGGSTQELVAVLPRALKNVAGSATGPKLLSKYDNLLKGTSMLVGVERFRFWFTDFGMNFFFTAPDDAIWKRKLAENPDPSAFDWLRMRTWHALRNSHTSILSREGDSLIVLGTAVLRYLTAKKRHATINAVSQHVRRIWQAGNTVYTLASYAYGAHFMNLGLQAVNGAESYGAIPYIGQFWAELANTHLITMLLPNVDTWFNIVIPEVEKVGLLDKIAGAIGTGVDYTGKIISGELSFEQLQTRVMAALAAKFTLSLSTAFWLFPWLAGTAFVLAGFAKFSPQYFTIGAGIILLKFTSLGIVLDYAVPIGLAVYGITQLVRPNVDTQGWRALLPHHLMARGMAQMRTYRAAQPGPALLLAAEWLDHVRIVAIVGVPLIVNTLYPPPPPLLGAAPMGITDDGDVTTDTRPDAVLDQARKQSGHARLTRETESDVFVWIAERQKAGSGHVVEQHLHALHAAIEALVGVQLDALLATGDAASGMPRHDKETEALQEALWQLGTAVAPELTSRAAQEAYVDYRVNQFATMVTTPPPPAEVPTTTKTDAPVDFEGNSNTPLNQRTNDSWLKRHGTALAIGIGTVGVAILLTKYAQQQTAVTDSFMQLVANNTNGTNVTPGAMCTALATKQVAAIYNLTTATGAVSNDGAVVSMVHAIANDATSNVPWPPAHLPTPDGFLQEWVVPGVTKLNAVGEKFHDGLNYIKVTNREGALQRMQEVVAANVTRVSDMVDIVGIAKDPLQAVLKDPNVPLVGEFMRTCESTATNAAAAAAAPPVDFIQRHLGAAVDKLRAMGLGARGSGSKAAALGLTQLFGWLTERFRETILGTWTRRTLEEMRKNDVSGALSFILGGPETRRLMAVTMVSTVNTYLLGRLLDGVIEVFKPNPALVAMEITERCLNVKNRWQAPELTREFDASMAWSRQFAYSTQTARYGLAGWDVLFPDSASWVHTVVFASPWTVLLATATTWVTLNCVSRMAQSVMRKSEWFKTSKIPRILNGTYGPAFITFAAGYQFLYGPALQPMQWLYFASAVAMLYPTAPLAVLETVLPRAWAAARTVHAPNKKQLSQQAPIPLGSDDEEDDDISSTPPPPPTPHDDMAVFAAFIQRTWQPALRQTYGADAAEVANALTPEQDAMLEDVFAELNGALKWKETKQLMQTL